MLSFLRYWSEFSVPITLLFFLLLFCSGFAIHCHESAMGVHVFPLLNPLYLPSPSHPSRSSQCTSLEHLPHASNLDWQSISQMVIYMF